MRTITLEELLEAGCHFGHQIMRQNPKARDFIFEARDNIHIIDLEKTKKGLEEAADYVKKLAQNSGTLLILGTKRQAEGILKEEIERVKSAEVDGLFWITKRWIGGTLTNFPEVSKNFRRLKELGLKVKDETERAKYTKKEIGLWDKERQKLEGFYGGISDMKKLPDAVFIIDTHLEDLAVRETLRMRVKTVGITDTNSDPSLIDYPIPANDDAVGSIKLIVDYIIDAWIEGRKSPKAVEKVQTDGETVKGREDEGIEVKKKEAKDSEVKEKKVKVKKATDKKKTTN